jgi:hypothetical protein
MLAEVVELVWVRFVVEALLRVGLMRLFVSLVAHDLVQMLDTAPLKWVEIILK